MEKLTFNDYPFLKELGLGESNHGVYRDGQWTGSGEEVLSYNPATGKPLARVKMGSAADYEACVKGMEAEKIRWMKTPAPIRGEVVRQIGEAFRKKKEALGMLISLEMGKIKSEG